MTRIICRGPGCRAIVSRARRWCSACWSKMPEARQGAITRCAEYLQAKPKDPAVLHLLACAIRDADRSLSGS